MDPHSIFRMFSRSRMLLSRGHLCVLSSIQLSTPTQIICFIHQETKLRRFSSAREPATEFHSNKTKKDWVNYPDEYIFSPKRNYDVNRTIFAGGLSKFTTVKSLYNHFLQFGTITGCRLERNKKTGVSMEYGFVEFELIEEAESASKVVHKIDDQEIGVRMGCEKELRQKCTLFVGGLSRETCVKKLREYFSKFGQIVQCAILRDGGNGSRGFGYVTFKSQDSIDSVLNASPHYIDNMAVNVRLAEERQREFTLYVRKLSPNTTNESLRAFYSKFGLEVTECEVKFDRQTGQSRGFGFVAFRSLEGLHAALAVQPHVIDDTEVELNYRANTFHVRVTCLHPNITEEALSDFFSRYGELRLCEILETLPGARTGFVEFRYEKDLLQALADRPHIINGKLVNTYKKKQGFSVFVSNLPSDATDDSLSEIFSKYGKIVYWQVKRDHNTKRPLGYGFVSFEKAEQAVQAVNGGPYILKGRTLRVKPRDPRGDSGVELLRREGIGS
ncbi:RNA recognition motif domain-containing protein [Ditylenchus destructor]|uniref:RNA recognition motif domain-containing protein n=1 Tax=Ditylenchus destructor TaxID=166010 RepID=A0AAD4MSQ4_9BILA|nr:RNA recognition motif domain-containing protein [Ditylenchus destructor]